MQGPKTTYDILLHNRVYNTARHGKSKRQYPSESVVLLACKDDSREKTCIASTHEICCIKCNLTVQVFPSEQGNRMD